MPVRYSFKDNLFHMEMEGSCTHKDVLEVFLSALEDPAFPSDPQFVFDVRKSEVLATRDPEEVKAVARFFSENAERVGNRCAIVASEPVHYGLSRMGAAFAEFGGAEVRVFRSLEEAVAWLGVGEDLG
jgi:hypothetical protein